MAVTYDATKDPLATSSNQAAILKRERANLAYPKSAAITPSDTVDLTSYARVVVIAAGNAKVLPTQNDDAVGITFTGLTVGTVLPFNVRRVFATGTTASLATLSA